MRRKEDHEKDTDTTMKQKENATQKECVLTPDELEAVKKKAKEFDELWDKHLRNCAEFDNARKRWEREKEEIIKFSNFLLIKELIITLDELHHALVSLRTHSDQEEIAKGIELTRNNLLSVLKKEGVTEIASLGNKFDPHMHEIVGQVPDDDKEEHIVINEAQRGYLLAGKVLRTAKVIISIKKEPKESGADEGEIPGEIDNEEKKEEDKHIDEEC